MKCLKRIEENRVVVLALMGANGSGKGTLAHLLFLLLSMTRSKVAVITVSKLIQQYLDEPDDKHTELGNKLRENRARLLKSARNGVITKNYDDNLIILLIDIAICGELDAGAQVLILDGFFRTVPQRIAFGRCSMLFLVHIIAELKDAMANAARRTTERAQMNPPLRPRPDDADWAVKERYGIYKTDTRASLDEHVKLDGEPVIRMGCLRSLQNKGMKIMTDLRAPQHVLDHLRQAFYNPDSEVAKFVAKIEKRPTQFQAQTLPRPRLQVAETRVAA